MKSAQTAYRSPVKSRYAAIRKPQRVVPQLRTAPQNQTVAPRPRRKQARPKAAPLPNGLNVMGLVVLLLAVIGGMLVISLGWQRRAHTLAQEEVTLHSTLNQISDERQQLLADEQRAANPYATAPRAAEAGLASYKLEERNRTATSNPASVRKRVLGKAMMKAPVAAQRLAQNVPAQKQKPVAAKSQLAAKPLATQTPHVKTTSGSAKPGASKSVAAKPATSTVPTLIAKAAGTKASLAR